MSNYPFGATQAQTQLSREPSIEAEYYKSIPVDRADQAGSIKGQAPIFASIANNDEMISSIELQLESLKERTAPVSNREPTPERDDPLYRSGDSNVAGAINSQGYRLSSISDTIAKLIRELEI